MNVLSRNGKAEAVRALSLVSTCDPPPFQIERLYDDGRARLWPALSRRLGNKVDAEDVLHEAFARFLARYAGQSLLNPLAMLAQIALNIVRDAARTESHRRELLALQSEPVCSVAPALDPEATLSCRQEGLLLRHAIDALPVRCREAFLLHCVEGLPHAEVARILGVSRSMVEKHVMGAYARLRARLEADGWAGIGGQGLRRS